MSRNRLISHSAALRARPRLEQLEDRAVPATFTVTTALDVVNATDGKLSLREAVTRSNDRPGPDSIILPAGVFKIAVDGANEDANATGDFDVTDAVTIRGAGAGLTVIDAQQKDRLFELIGSINVRFASVTLRHGAAPVNGGGAIQALDADVTLVGCTVSDNRALEGGGIHAEGGDVTLVGTAVLRNVAENDGGGVLLGSGALTATGSTVRRNMTGGSGGGLAADTVRLTSSSVNGNSAFSGGGGISAGTVTMTGSMVHNNSSGEEGGDPTLEKGGGIFAVTVTATKSTVRGNATGGDGGGIAADSVTLTGCTISSNSADADGGGISATTAVVTNTTVNANAALNRAFGVSAGRGGGVFATSATVDASTVSDNSADVRGGAIFAADSVTANRSTVSGNSAGYVGGGIYTEGTANLTACTVSGNTADTAGGVFAATGALLDCTIADNLAHRVGGLVTSFSRGALTLMNTICALNVADVPGAGPDIGNGFISLGHNLIGDGTAGTGFTDGVNGDMVGTAASPIDPKLGPLAANGGPTQTMALLAGSPAIDAGDNTNAPATDQRGRPRKKDGNGDGRAVVDIGAFER